MNKITMLPTGDDGSEPRRRLHLRDITNEVPVEAESVGADLRAARLRRGEDIRSIAQSLRIRRDQLEALEESRYPITNIGMRNLLELTIAQWNSELNVPDAKVRYFPNAKVGDVECRVFESSYDEKHKGVKFHMTRLYVNKENSFPVRVEQFDFPTKAGAQPAILEQYTYLDVKPNAGLHDIDFDVKNPSYDF